MGQQQLLLIVLGIIILGIAVVIGISIFDAQTIESNRVAIQTELNRISAFAQQYYATPKTQGGGNRSFVGFQIPAAITKTDNGESSVITEAEDRLLLQIIGVEKEGDDFVTYQLLVKPKNAVMQKIN